MENLSLKQKFEKEFDKLYEDELETDLVLKKAEFLKTAKEQAPVSFCYTILCCIFITFCTEYKNDDLLFATTLFVIVYIFMLSINIQSKLDSSNSNSKNVFTKKIMSLFQNLYPIECNTQKNETLSSLFYEENFLNDICQSNNIVTDKIKTINKKNIFTGKINNIDFVFGKMEAIKTFGYSRRRRNSCCFDGVLLAFDLNKSFNNFSLQYVRFPILKTLETLLIALLFIFAIFLPLLVLGQDALSHYIENIPLKKIIPLIFLFIGILLFVFKEKIKFTKKEATPIKKPFYHIKGDLTNFPNFFNVEMNEKIKTLAKDFSSINIKIAIHDNLILFFIETSRKNFELEYSYLFSENKKVFKNMKNELFSIISFMDYFTKKC